MIPRPQSIYDAIDSELLECHKKCDRICFLFHWSHISSNNGRKYTGQTECKDNGFRVAAKNFTADLCLKFLAAQKICFSVTAVSDYAACTRTSRHVLLL